MPAQGAPKRLPDNEPAARLPLGPRRQPVVAAGLGPPPDPFRVTMIVQPPCQGFGAVGAAWKAAGVPSEWGVRLTADLPVCWDFRGDPALLRSPSGVPPSSPPGFIQLPIDA